MRDESGFSVTLSHRTRRLPTHSARTACTDMYIAGTLNVSKKICAACSRFELGLSGASVSRTGCCASREAG